jgi:hypothetical protein
MPTPKSSSKGNTTKIITPEMVRSRTVVELAKPQQEGWEFANPPKPWTVSEDDSPNTETYYGAILPTVPGKEKTPTDPKLEAALNDPELKKIADQIGTTPHSLLLMRELLLDRHGHHEVDDNED